MKRIIFLFALASIAITSYSQTLLVENFTYPAGTQLNNSMPDWMIIGANTSYPILVTSPSISYSGYDSSDIGNEVTINNNNGGQDLYREFTPQTDGAVYVSIIVKVDSATTSGDYFFLLTPSPFASSYYGRIFAKLNSNNKLAFGTLFNTGGTTTPTPTYSDFSYDLKSTYLIVLKFTITGSSISSSIIVNPTINGTEPTLGWLENLRLEQTLPSNIGSVTLRQGGTSKSPIVKMDGIRIGKTWLDVLPFDLEAPTVPIGLLSSKHDNNSFVLAWNESGDKVGVIAYEVYKNREYYGTTTSTSINIDGLTPETLYNMKVRAKSASGHLSSFSSVLVVNTTGNIPEAASDISGVINVCQGQNTVTYTVPTIAYATSYIWTLPTGATGTSTTNSITVNYTKTAISGNITVKGHNQWGDGVVSTLAVTASLLPLYAGTVSGNTSVCQGQSSVNYSVPAIDNATSYIWTLPNGATGTSTTNSITVNYGINAVSGNITVKGHNDCGDGVVSTLPITVNQLPVITVTDKTVICGGTVSLNATTNYSGSGTLTYQWSPTTGLNDASLANPTATVINDITYNVTVTTLNGCTANDNIKVTVNPLIANAGADKTNICGGTAQLNSVTTNYTGNGTLKYKWTPATGLNNDSIINPTAILINDVVYTVTVKTPNGCTATDQVSVSIIPMTKPEIGMVGVSSNNKNLIAWNKPFSTGVESYYVYRETNVTNVYEQIGTVPYDSLSIYIDNQSLPDVQSNKYKLSIYDRHGLESPQSNSHKTMHLAINKGVGYAWNLSWEAYEGFVVSTYNIYRGTTPTNLTLLGSTSGSNTQYNDMNAPSGNIYYQLEIISPNSVNPTKIISSQKIKTEENGSFNSQISYSSSRSNIATNVVSGINELGENTKINIYPNPVKDELRIDFEGGSTFEILNLMGQVVHEGNLIKSAIVQTSNLLSGIYLIKFKTGKTFEYKKIIKE